MKEFLYSLSLNKLIKEKIYSEFVDCGTGERKLLNDLMAYYQKLERPVANESEAVQLRFGLTLQQIMDVVSDSILRKFWSTCHKQNW